MEQFIIKIDVGTAIKQFIMATHGSDLIIPPKDSILWAIIKLNLVTFPYCNCVDEVSDDRAIRIAILNKQSMKYYNVQAQRVLCINTMFRCYLSDKGVMAIKQFFEKNMRHIFLLFMEGYNISNEKNISFAIREFCMLYSVDYDDKMFAKLRKSWYRHKKKISEKDVCPIIF